MGAQNVSHGVITIDVKDIRPAKVAENLERAAFAAITNHPISTGSAPEPVVQYATTPVEATPEPEQAKPEGEQAPV